MKLIKNKLGFVKKLKSIRRKIQIVQKLKVMAWGYRLACQIDKKCFFGWLLVSILIAFLPSVTILLNKNAVAALTGYITSAGREGDFSVIARAVCALGAVLILQGISKRFRNDFLYMVMYDKYYLGMEEYVADCIQRVNMKQLMDKKFQEDYHFMTYRCGSLNDLVSDTCCVVMQLVSSISLLFVAWSISGAVFLIALIYFLLVLIWNLFMSDKVIDNGHMREARNRENYLYEEPLKPGVAREIRMYNIKEKVISQWKEAWNPVEKYVKSINRNRRLSSFGMGIGIYICIFLMLLYALPQTAAGNMTVELFFTLYLLGESLSQIHETLSLSLMDGFRGLHALEFQYRFIHSVTMGEDRELLSETMERTLEKQRAKSDIVFEAKNLSFSYDGQHKVLHGLNFQIKKGETIALVGVNGSGKSTLVKLLTGLYQPDEGNLLLYGKPYEEYPEGSVNHCIGMFFQDYYLFHASIRENVGFGNLMNLTKEEKIHTAMKKGGAQKLLEQLNGNLELWLGREIKQDGVLLSGGEKQKIAVSRAHMSEKEILIFDEPAAAIDPIAEMEQFEQIRRKIDGKTAILISHRVGFARMADRIFVLENGCLAEVGTHSELVKEKGIYADFFCTQAKWYEGKEEEK